MKQIKLSPSFRGSLKKWVRRHPDKAFLLIEKLLLFHADPFNPILETHQLTGKLAGLHAFSVAYDARIIIRIVDDKNIILEDMGTHDEVY